MFYVGSKQEMALEYISACALFSRAFNQLADADVYEQTFWDRDKKEEILTLHDPLSEQWIQNSGSCLPVRQTCAAFRGMW